MGRAGHADLHVFWSARDVVTGRDKTNSLFSGGSDGGRIPSVGVERFRLKEKRGGGDGEKIGLLAIVLSLRYACSVRGMPLARLIR